MISNIFVNVLNDSTEIDLTTGTDLFAEYGIDNDPVVIFTTLPPQTVNTEVPDVLEANLSVTVKGYSTKDSDRLCKKIKNIILAMNGSYTYDGVEHYDILSVRMFSEPAPIELENVKIFRMNVKVFYREKMD